MKVELLSLYLQYDWSRHRESNPNYGIESPVSLPFRRWRDRNRSDRPPIGSVVPLLSVVFKWCYRHRFASGGVSSPMEFVDTIIEPSPSNKRFLRLSVVRIIKRRAKFISTRGTSHLVAAVLRIELSPSLLESEALDHYAKPHHSSF